MGDTLPIRVIYRSRGIQLSLLAAMAACDAWGRAGLDIGDGVPWVKDAPDGDAMLEAGEVDFIFGSHVTPYIRFADGIPFVYLGQTVNWSDDVVVSARPLGNLQQLRGQRLAERLTRQSHSRGNRILFLRRAGIDEDEVEWVEKGSRASLDVVASGDADAAFMSPLDAFRAGELGLNTYTPQRLPMVVGSTITTLWPTVKQRPELCRRVLTAVRHGVRFFQTDVEAMRKVMSSVVGPELGIDAEEALERLYRRNRTLLEEDLYPRLDAISNAFALAVRQAPGLDKRIKPLELWNLNFLRELDAAA
jgi:hypothetical protein